MLPSETSNAPQGLKPMFYAASTARLKPCPFKTCLCSQFQLPFMLDDVYSS
jgi:hypothetical protein